MSGFFILRFRRIPRPDGHRGEDEAEVYDLICELVPIRQRAKKAKANTDRIATLRGKIFCPPSPVH